MNHISNCDRARRKFIKMLAASPLIATSPSLSGSLASLLAITDSAETKFLDGLENLQQDDNVLSSPDQALDVLEFEAAARKASSATHGPAAPGS